jgi:hypothetical protein
VSPIVVTTCSNRKLHSPSDALSARNLERGSLEQIAYEWGRRVAEAEERFLPLDLYCGRGIREAEAAAANLDQAPYVVSAGMGLLSPSTMVPAYDLTLSVGSQDCIFKRIAEPVRATDWWEAMGEALGTPNPFARLVTDRPGGSVLIACAGHYLDLISDDLLSLDSTDLQRVRLFGPQDVSKVKQRLGPLVMPYDDRFDGANCPIPGTKSDLAQRSLRHFANSMKSNRNLGRDPGYDVNWVRDLLKTWERPERHQRQKLTDAEIINLVPRLWERADGSSVKMLRVLRDQEKVACEQGRFANLFKVAKERHSL